MAEMYSFRFVCGAGEGAKGGQGGFRRGERVKANGWRRGTDQKIYGFHGNKCRGSKAKAEGE